MKDNHKLEHFDELTYRGWMLLRILGNGSPSLSQMEFAQSIITLIAEDDDPVKNQQLSELISQYSTQTRETIQRDSLYARLYGDEV